MDRVVAPDESAIARVHAAAVLPVIPFQTLRQASLAAKLLNRLPRAPHRKREGIRALRTVVQHILRAERAQFENHAQIAACRSAHGRGHLAPRRGGQREGVFIEKSRFRQAAGEVVAVAALAQGGKQFAPRAQKRFLILRPQQTVQRLRHRPV